jgi:hypothetical protein
MSDRDKMAREDRKQLVLETLRDGRLALPPRVLLRNVKLRGGRFEISAMKRYLDELEAEGLVRKVDPEQLAQRDLVDVAEGERGYWIAVETGE